MCEREMGNYDRIEVGGMDGGCCLNGLRMRVFGLGFGFWFATLLS